MGHWFTFAAISRGDMSVVVPAMGTKAFFVAIAASAFFGKTINPATWMAAVLAAVGIYVLGRSDRTKSKGVSIAILFTTISSACFGFCDAAIQALAPSYGAKGFMGMTFLMIAGLSSLFLRAADHPLREADKQGMKALFIGAGIIALQGILVCISVVSFDNATGVNIVYTSRGLWSVLLVWWIGHRFHSGGKIQDRKLLLARLIGATIMMVAVGLALKESAN
jgi:drug/metabolite transporter (DMT)-like permease